MARETIQNTLDRLQYLFGKARSKLISQSHKSVKNSVLYNAEVDFMYILHSIKFDAQYVRSQKIQEAKELIRKLENLVED